MISVPPGWYPDPSPAMPPDVPPLQRWWDGTQWTGHVQPAPGPAGHGPAGPTTPDGEPLAGWWWRVLAALIDGAVLIVVAGLITLRTQIEVQRELADRQREFQEQLNRGLTPDFGDYFRGTFDVYGDHIVMIAVVPLLIGLVYTAGFLRWRGATPGKMVCGLRVRLRARPGRLPWGTIAARLTVWSLLPGLALVLAFGYGSIAVVVLVELAVSAYYLTDALWAAATAKRQSLHDLAARTNVVRSR